MVETGFTQAKNAGHTMAMNFMVYPLGMLGYWICGFALQMGGVGAGTLSGGTALLTNEFTIHLFGKDFGLFGTTGFFLSGVSYDAAIFALFLFQMVFMDTTATIPTGSMAERWNFKSFVIYGLFVGGIIYPLYANWVWGGGWLAQAGVNWGLGHGAVDFAGSGVVHSMGGIIALAGAIVVGPRIGKYDKQGKPQPIPGHNIPIVVLGTFILAFGWFGFNPGSTLAGTDLRISFVVVNTLLASITGALGAMVALEIKGLKHDPSMLCNGMLAGLVAITAPCAFVSPWAGAAIGAIAGVVVVYSVLFFEKAGVDDCVGAISVHGVCGLWGVLSVGIFANGDYGAGWNGVVRDEMVKLYGSDGVRGLLYGDFSQFLAQSLDCVVVAVFGFAMAYVWFKVSDLITPIRVAPEVELEGLDIPEVGAPGYPDFAIRTVGGAHHVMSQE
jgi:Amt family ammonium transporter